MVAFVRPLKLLAASAILMSAACASAPAGVSPAEPGQHVITVLNDHTSFTEILVSIVPFGGTAQQLGVVPGGETRALAFEGNRGSYHLLARRAGGDARTDTFNLPDSGHVEWRTSQRRVQVRSR
jgi:hypothetical protein